MSNLSSELLSCEDANSERTLQDLLEPVNNPNGRTDFRVKEVIPTPGFVIKSRDEWGQKVFINICGCEEIPTPENWNHGQIPDELLHTLQSSQEQNCDISATRFPLSLSLCRNDVDKQGEPCTVYDCLFNLHVVSEAKRYKELEIFLVGVAMNWLTKKNQVKLNSNYKRPRLLYKGKELAPHRIKVKKEPIVQEMEDRKKTQHSSDFCFRFGKPNYKNEKKPSKRTDAESSNKVEKKVVQVKEKQDPSLTDWQHEVKFVGKPVEKMNVLLSLPKTLKEECPEISLCGLNLKINFRESDASCNLPLPFPGDSESTEVVVDYCERQMRLLIPVLPVSDFLDKTTAQN
eukprot:g4504.t1